MKNDKDFGKTLIEISKMPKDESIHAQEHSIEVQLPFLQFINKGRIVAYQQYAFDDPIHEIKQITNQRLEWTSTTGGDPDGVILNLDAPNNTRLNFYSKPITFSIDLENITNDPCIIEADGVEQQVKITTISNQQLPKNLEFSYIDSKPKNGNNSYWVKVTQSDGNMAWSSPLFVYYKP